LSVIRFKGSQAGGEQLPFRHNHNVEARSWVAVPENLSYQTFSAIPVDRVSQLARGRYSEAADGQLGGVNEQDAVPTADARPPVVDSLEVGAPPDALLGP
jgi:hypothetical protein